MTAEDEGVVAIALQGDLVIGNVKEVARQWLQDLQVPGPVVVACEGLGRIDTAGLQLLASLRRTCLVSKRPMHLKDPPSTLLQTLERCGLSGEMPMGFGN